jgi:hypothetical protein
MLVTRSSSRREEKAMTEPTPMLDIEAGLREVLERGPGPEGASE